MWRPPTPHWYCALLTLAAVGGCAASGRHRHTGDSASGPQRNTVAAQQHNSEGLRQLNVGDYQGAEVSFRAAVEHDLYCVPAHNNLGLVLLRKGEYYDAAWEFHTAAKLAPEQSEPRANLANLYEEIGRLEDAITEYEAAIDIDPDNLVAMRQLARACVKAGRNDDKTRSLLERLTTHADGDQWDYWVRGQVIRFGRSEAQTHEPTARRNAP